MEESTLLRAVPLNRESFAEFGDVIESDGRAWRDINDDTCRRYDDLASLDVLEQQGRPLISIFSALPRVLPLRLATLERHPLSSQAFYPLEGRPFLIVVATAAAAGWKERVRVYVSSGRQGVNYRRNTWHHALIALHVASDFLVVDRGGPSANCDEVAIDGPPILVTE